ncbi:hypothetical protein [Candidatus Methylopumilus rimovensis]|jgi:hypothetical protein|uniref:hypothetical protein n=1 Tax=Candidatus Methylopumilus rimovensis TaxID=2588535 RepID=UPI001121940E|nr:hypothetical protein [Candidatus Methylopumilus rimovensis]QDD11879.1 hypothetical protein FIT62_01700 [Candidatus Methylopumilus rimovensis]
MVETIENHNPDAFFCPHCNTKIKPDDEKEEEYEDPMNYCEHVLYSLTSEGIDYLSESAETELLNKGFEIKKDGGFIEIDNPKDEDFNFQDIVEILDSKNLKNYRFSSNSSWGLEVDIGICER